MREAVTADRRPERAVPSAAVARADHQHVGLTVRDRHQRRVGGAPGDERPHRQPGALGAEHAVERLEQPLPRARRSHSGTMTDAAGDRREARSLRLPGKQRDR
ncbi:hypothetical protein GCM10010448_06140 [Streptomyces glomeratus]|uniref:Uncharacterized protein n=1 Tax=Streptomyces glomeratus TaxID=284452 RepID=A0ABP6L2N9_9ACTN